jgi:RHS repeat-associated protein
MRWFLFLTFSLRLFAGVFDKVVPSSSEEILSLTTDLIVDGFVSVTSGQLSISEVDLRVKGAQDLVLKKIYVPPRVLGRYDDREQLDRLALGKALCQLETKGWVVYPHLWAGYNRHSKYFQVPDPQGFVLEFQIQGNKGILKTAAYGCSNLRGETPDSSADIRNIELLVEGDIIKVSWPNGIQRQYSKQALSIYRLEKEILSNGKVIRYEYKAGDLFRISSSDPAGKFTYASITKGSSDHYLSSDGREASFVYEKREIKGKYKKGGYEESGVFQFPVMTKSSNPTYANTAAYNERALLNGYDAKNYPISCTYFQTKNVPARIQTFSNPSGSFSFSYDPAIAGQKSGSTTVNHPDGMQTIYRFSKLLLLQGIENWLDGRLINKKTFKYDSKQHIKRIETLDGQDKVLLSKQFECDSAGNAILETTVGDFGAFSIRRKFDKNRLIFEDYDDGLQYAFTYLGDTRLVTSKTTLESGKQLRKTVYSYDEANNLVQIEEEGKTRTAYTLYQTAPHLHRVKWEEKSDWNGQLLHKIHYAYDSWGNANEEQHYGSDGQCAYTMKRTYNEKGELLEETNPLGEMALYQYDTRGRCFYEEPFSNGLTIRRTFDDKGRLTLLQEDDHETRFNYNASDELIQKTDYLGYTTAYHYDPVHGKPDRIEEPSSVTEIVYDVFGREKERIDPYKFKTIKTYNSYGDVTKITRPKGGEEVFDYFPNGLLKSHTDADGLVTTYAYDALGRTKEKTVGEYTTAFHYDGYNLFESIDAAGFVTEYEYDLAGRKIKEKRQDRVTHYGYDPLGFLAWEKKDGRSIEYINDSLGQALKKSVDGVLETAWVYDPGGNIAAIEQGGLATFKFDAHNRLTEKMDPKGNRTVIHYEKGPQVLLKKIRDPASIETIETYNPQDQLLKKEVDGQVVEEFEYDKLFRLKKQDHLTFGFDLNGNKEQISEANLRTTAWTYTPADRLSTKQKPDGTVVSYSYDPQFRPQKIGAREFCYDRLDRLIGGTGFSRTLDAFGNIKREEWTNGLWIESDYDAWDRPIMRRLPDQTRIEYSYEGPFLKKVARVSSNGKELYAHTYEEYDQKGNPRKSFGSFETVWEYDELGRKIGQKSPYYIEIAEYGPSGNLIRRNDSTYTYDSLSQMTSQSDRFTARYDVHYNLSELNGQPIAVDSLNQVEGMSYDLNGNLTRPGFVYDEFDQLVESAEGRCIYDALGRRIQKGKTAFIYIGDEEIGAFENGEFKELKIPGLLAPVAIEINQVPYAPIVDVQGITRLLIDWRTSKIFKQNDCDVFGSGLSDEIPYAYAGKRYDPKTGLLYFGKRYYDPALRRWLTPDPIGSVNHSNMYQYLFNNPYLYQDDTGELAIAIPLLIWGAELAVPGISAWVTAIVSGAAVGAIAYGGYKLVETFNDRGYSALNDYHSGDLTWVSKSDEDPPYDGKELGTDPTASPGKEFEWKGKGKPGSKQGSWYNPNTGESLHPDLDHPPPIKPHWDYEGPNGEKARLNTDGTWDWKR